MHVEDKRSLPGSVNIFLFHLYMNFSPFLFKNLKDFEDMTKPKRTFHETLSSLSNVYSLKLCLVDRKLSPSATRGSGFHPHKGKYLTTYYQVANISSQEIQGI